MTAQDGRGYQTVYRPSNYEIDDTAPLIRHSTRDSEYRYPPQRGYDAAPDRRSRPSAVRPISSDDYYYRPSHSNRYQTGQDVIVVEAPRRRGPVEYVVEYPRRRHDRIYDRDGYHRSANDKLTDRSSQRSPDRGLTLRKVPTAPLYLDPDDSGRRSPMPSSIHRASDLDSDAIAARGRGSDHYPTRAPPPGLRSAMRGSRAADPSPSSTQRRRARSVSVREDETEIVRHEVGHQWHERPGREARHAGKYLGHPLDDDLMSETYVERTKESAHQGGRRRRKSRSSRYDDDD